MRISINGTLEKGVSPKDVALYIISELTTSGATGYFVEYAGEVFEKTDTFRYQPQSYRASQGLRL